MHTDTVIRHVTKPGANVFLELGFPPAEARRLDTASKKQIDDARPPTRSPAEPPSRPR